MHFDVSVFCFFFSSSAGHVDIMHLTAVIISYSATTRYSTKPTYSYLPTTSGAITIQQYKYLPEGIFQGPAANRTHESG